MENFADLLFKNAVREEQERLGSAEHFQKAYANRFRNGLGPDEKAFIETRDTFYMATVNEDGWPYVQHRGGPKGFLKVIGPDTLAMADYKGNAQYISAGHLKSGSKIALILMDYPRQARLKILGEAKMSDATDAGLVRNLAVEGQGPVERVLEITVRAFDWNCPKYISQRFTKEEVAALIAPTLTKLESRIKELEEGLG